MRQIGESSKLNLLLTHTGAKSPWTTVLGHIRTNRQNKIRTVLVQKWTNGQNKIVISFEVWSKSTNNLFLVAMSSYKPTVAIKSASISVLEWGSLIGCSSKQCLVNNLQCRANMLLSSVQLKTQLLAIKSL